MRHQRIDWFLDIGFALLGSFLLALGVVFAIGVISVWSGPPEPYVGLRWGVLLFLGSAALCLCTAGSLLVVGSIKSVLQTRRRPSVRG